MRPGSVTERRKAWYTGVLRWWAASTASAAVSPAPTTSTGSEDWSSSPREMAASSSQKEWHTPGSSIQLARLRRHSSGDEWSSPKSLSGSSSESNSTATGLDERPSRPSHRYSRS
ncbi:hypothetical protein EYF80_050883 [Liparis tanakae]|uniref:Uncharacterized protein n=1 Tax=Liparis tanakae TaxID=230148 RepID=A0A4Z2FCP3_9TELE|nr:hypothetical protein EYF80_050883 [Liparis tanakae]